MTTSVQSALRVLIVPSYQLSQDNACEKIWQNNVADDLRISSIESDEPLVLANWAEKVRDEIAQYPSPVWIVAFDFACLAAIVAAADRPQCVAGLVLVTPSDPLRLDLLGGSPITKKKNQVSNLAEVLPQFNLGIPGLLIHCEEGDIAMASHIASSWAKNWGLGYISMNVSRAEIAVDHWQRIRKFMCETQDKWPLAKFQNVAVETRMRRGRGSALAKVRRHTRVQMEYTTSNL